jgi:hypothetical protein
LVLKIFGIDRIEAMPFNGSLLVDEDLYAFAEVLLQVVVHVVDLFVQVVGVGLVGLADHVDEVLALERRP